MRIFVFISFYSSTRSHLNHSIYWPSPRGFSYPFRAFQNVPIAAQITPTKEGRGRSLWLSIPMMSIKGWDYPGPWWASIQQRSPIPALWDYGNFQLPFAMSAGKYGNWTVEFLELPDSKSVKSYSEERFTSSSVTSLSAANELNMWPDVYPPL